MINKAFSDKIAESVCGKNESGTYVIIPFTKCDTKGIVVHKFDFYGEIEDSETFALESDVDVIEKAEEILAFATK